MAAGRAAGAAWQLISRYRGAGSVKLIGQRSKTAPVWTPVDVWNWADQHHRTELGEAVRRHALDRTPAVYNSIAEANISKLDEIDPGAILNADFGGAGRAHNGKGTARQGCGKCGPSTGYGQHIFSVLESPGGC